MTLRSARVLALIAAVSLLIGCAQSVTGQATVDASRVSAGPQIAPRSGSGGRTSSIPEPTTTSSTTRTTTITPSTTSASVPPSSGPGTITSSETTTEYTTVFESGGGSTAAGAPASGPADVIGSPSLGPDASGFVNFQSPSGNIMCSIIDSASYGGARCDIADWHYTAPSGPDCGVTGWHGGTASVGDSEAGAVGGCIGDTVANPANPVLAYGQNAVAGSYGCHSAENGVTCANLLTRHGFRLSRDSFDVF